VAGEVNESAIVDDATASLAHDCRLHWVIEDLLAGGLVPLLADSGPFLWLFPEEGLDASRENDHAPSARSASVSSLVAYRPERSPAGLPRL
jgi:hypothetical protein